MTDDGRPVRIIDLKEKNSTILFTVEFVESQTKHCPPLCTRCSSPMDKSNLCLSFTIPSSEERTDFVSTYYSVCRSCIIKTFSKK